MKIRKQLMKTRLLYSSTLLLLGALFLLPGTVSVHGQTGTVCILPFGGSSCPSSQASITGVVGSQVGVSVFIQGSDHINGFDITLLSNDTILQPAYLSFIGSILPSPQTILVECLRGSLFKGNACSPTDTVNTIHFAAVGAGGQFSANTTGLLFRAIYNVTADSSGAPLVFQTGCGTATAPTSHPPLCVTITNGANPPVPENVQTAVYSTGAGPDFTITDQTSTITIQQGNNLAFDSFGFSQPNGLTTTVSLTSSVSPSGGPTSAMNPMSVSLSPRGLPVSTLTVAVTPSTPTGAYVVTVTGTTGTLSHSVTVSVTVTPAPKPDFTLSVTPSSLFVDRGTSTSYGIVVRSANGFNGTVALSVTVSPAVRHAPTTFQPSTVGPNSSSALGVVTAHNTPTGTYTITVTATSGTITHTASVILMAT